MTIFFFFFLNRHEFEVVHLIVKELHGCNTFKSVSHIIHLTLWIKKYIAIQIAILLHYEHNFSKVLFYYFQTAISSESHEPRKDMLTSKNGSNQTHFDKSSFSEAKNRFFSILDNLELQLMKTFFLQHMFI